MKKFIIPALAIVLFACGGEEETTSDSTDTNDETTDTSSVDTVATTEEEEGIIVEYFEDYAQFDTKTKLYEAFGEENIVDDEAWYAEGTVRFDISTLTDPNNGNMIQFTWSEEDPEQLSFIETWRLNWRIEGAEEQRIETKEGMYTGMPLDELVKWNGEDFDFSGFGWDYAGSILNDARGKLANSDVNPTLDMLDSGYESHGDLLGDMVFNSSDDAVQGAPIVIGSISYYIPK